MKRFTKLFAVVILLSACNAPTTKNNFSETKITSNDLYKPAYHFTPDSNWINDPNGLVYLDGEYHLFYQYNPFGVKWGHMSWGHSVSKDLVHWQKLPVALLEDKNQHDNDTAMIFSGSAVMDKNNSSGFGTLQNPPMVAIYTSFVHGGRYKGSNDYIEKAQSQSIAYSIDKGRTFKKYDGNPVLDINSLDFRDPKVFWYEPESKWVLALVKSDRQEVWFYESKNLKAWNYMSRWGRAGNTATVWECPDLFELPVLGTNEKKWILMLSAGHPQEKFAGMQYFVGDFNGKTFTPIKKYEEADYLDFGKDYYAAVTYNDAPNNQRIAIGWLNSWAYANDIPTGNVWRGAYAVPRLLSLKKEANDYFLYQQPVKEFDLNTKETFELPLQIVDGKFNVDYRGNVYEMELLIEPLKAKEAGIKILQSKNEGTVIKYDVATQQLLFDRTKSGNVSFNRRFPSVEKAPCKLHDGKLKLKILVDKCIVEVFINDGKTTLTDLVFPIEKNGGIELFSQGGKVLFKDVKIRNIKE